MSEDSVLHGLNIDEDAMQGDLHRTSAASSVNRDLELAMWTNLHFPEEPIFSPERDQASKSRHKLVDSPPLSGNNTSLSNSTGETVASGYNFFGSVGASLLPENGRTKIPTSNQHNPGPIGPTGHGALHDLFSWGMFDPSAAHHALFTNRPDVNVDPFLSTNGPSSASTSDNTAGGVGVGAGARADDLSPYAMGRDALPPLTLKESGVLKAKQAAMMAQNSRAIDPANTTLAGPPAKRARLPSLNTNPVIPVSYAHPETPIMHPALSDAGGDDDMEASPIHQGHGLGHGHSHSLDGHGLGLDKSMVGMNPAEDKRRRNTLASARFRAKKKEREAAMERKARELDEKVADLERECEVLRKENQWLKGLVVGASTTTPPNGVTAPVPEEPVNNNTNTNSGHNTGSTANVTASVESSLAAKGSVIDVDELLRVLKASGAVLTGSTVAEGSTQKAQGPTPATGKRKRANNN